MSSAFEQKEVQMERITQSLLILMALGLMTVSSGCKPKDIPQASLWPEGAWLIYQQERLDSDGKQFTGNLKVSCVGRESIENVPYYWLELREDKADGGVTITKFLASERKNFNPDESFVFWDDVKRIIVQEDMKTPEEIPAQHLKRFAPSFIESGKSKRFGNVQDLTPPEVTDLPEKSVTLDSKQLKCSGKKSHRKFMSTVNLGFLHLEDTSEVTTEYYISPEIPFGGIVSVTYSSTTSTVNKLKPEAEAKAPVQFSNVMQLKQFGLTGATTQIIGDPIEKQVLPFPFLKGGANKPQSN
jgi:hypothetical protein